MKAVPIVTRSTGGCGLLVEVSTDGFAVVVGIVTGGVTVELSIRISNLNLKIT
jgi:hypothetical protein